MWRHIIDLIPSMGYCELNDIGLIQVELLFDTTSAVQFFDDVPFASLSLSPVSLFSKLLCKFSFHRYTGDDLCQMNEWWQGNVQIRLTARGPTPAERQFSGWTSDETGL